MEGIEKTIYYCSVSKRGQILYAYNGEDPEIERLGALCLERAPSYHRWYFQTMGKKIFGFLMDDVYLYFLIAHETLGKLEALGFLEHLRDEFKLLAKNGISKSISSLNSLCLQEQLVPVVRRLVTSLENVTGARTDWPVNRSSLDQVNLSHSVCNNDSNGQSDGSGSTKAPLLGKPTKQEKKKMNDHVIALRDIELEEHRKSTERGNKVDSGSLDSSNGGVSVSPSSLQKDSGSFRTRSSSQNIRRKWWRQVRIILAIDALVCLVLFAVWLVICNGVECVR